MFDNLFRKWFDTSDKDVKAIEPLVQQTNGLEPEMQKLSLEEIRAKTDDFRQRLKDGTALDDLIPEAFAACREVSRRLLNMRHFDVQLIGGVVLHHGKITEMKTGEGKTLVAPLALYLNALEGRGTHLVTVNDYLARRDAVWMGPIYHGLGLTLGVIQGQSAESDELGGSYKYTPGHQAEDPRYHNLVPCSRAEAYDCDVTYGTNHEFGFDYLRDNMAFDKSQLVMRELHYAIVDEVDSILVDEARTPHVISGRAEQDVTVYAKINGVVRKLQKEKHYTADEKSHQISMTDEGYDESQRILGIENLADHPELMHYINAGLKAHALFKKDVDYVVKEGEVVIVDDTTGRLMFGRRYSDGLHQAIEAKEGVPIRHESQTVAVITFQNLFRLYHKLAGMTGTAKTEEDEFRKIYGLSVVVIPTHKQMIRIDQPDIVYKSEEQKFRGIARELFRLFVKQQPVLVGTRSIEMSEKVSNWLTPKILQSLLIVDRIRDRIQNDKSLSKDKKNHLNKLVNVPIDKLDRNTLSTDLRELGISPDPLADEHRPWFLKLHQLPDENGEHFDEAIRYGIRHNVLNAKFHEKEALIIAEAGRKGAITIATNMAGRGVDILLGGRVQNEETDRVQDGDDERADTYHDTFTSYRRGGKERAAPPLPLSDQERSELAKVVTSLGGVYILGTERHESRRIDNQLRGRSGRQGDPGESRYFVSLEDKLWQVFGSNMLQNPLLKTWPEDEQIEVKFLSNTIRKIQERIEFHFFEYRKHILEYDDVMNVQREKIYADRRKVLLGADMRGKVLADVESVIEDRIDGYFDPETQTYNYENIYRSLNEVFPLAVYAGQELLDGLPKDRMLEKIFPLMHKAYDEREEQHDSDTIRGIERFIVLKAINDRWMEHLQNVDQLREGISLRGYAQMDPLIAFKKDSHILFQETLANITEQVAMYAFHVTPQKEQQRPMQMIKIDENQPSAAPGGIPAAAFPSNGAPTNGADFSKVGRNDPCPCGSGKKFKNCHMRQVQP